MLCMHYASYIHELWYIWIRNASRYNLYVRHDWVLCVTWSIRLCDMTHSYLRDVTHSYVGHDSFICVTWLVLMCDMTRSYVWHDSCICWTWLVHKYASYVYESVMSYIPMNLVTYVYEHVMSCTHHTIHTHTHTAKSHSHTHTHTHAHTHTHTHTRVHKLTHTLSWECT